jgi:hypothetical protein
VHADCGHRAAPTREGHGRKKRTVTHHRHRGYHAKVADRACWVAGGRIRPTRDIIGATTCPTRGGGEVLLDL